MQQRLEALPVRMEERIERKRAAIAVLRDTLNSRNIAHSDAIGALNSGESPGALLASQPVPRRSTPDATLTVESI